MDVRKTMELDYKQIGENIRSELKKRSWEQQEFAIVLRIDQSLLSGILQVKGKYPLKLQSMQLKSLV